MRKLVVGALVVTVAVTLSFSALRAQEPAVQSSRCGEAHEAMAEANLHVATVRQKADGAYEVVMCEGFESERGEAERILRECLANPPRRTQARTVEEALVILHFEPDNVSAQQLLRSRYEEVRTRTR